LQFAPSTYYERRAIMRDPDRASARAKSDAAPSLKIDAAWDANSKLYGARKIWHVLRRQGEDAAGCTVGRLMRHLGIRGVARGKKVITTQPDAPLPCPDDKVNRLFMADRPNKRWVSDFTYVPTWSGTVYVAFVIDVFARRIVGWHASTSMKAQFVLDALEHAIRQRKTADNNSLVHHSDRGSQYLSIKYTERLAEDEIDLSVGTVGDAYDRASGCHWFKTTGEGPGRMRHRPVQDRGHQPDRPLETDARGRMGTPQMGRSG
jgi:putative transposase